MTPQLQQAIKLLQLSNQELGEFVEQELEQNPLLERDESDAEPAVGDTANGSAVDSVGPMINGEHTAADNLARPGPDLPESAPPPEGAIATIEGEPLFDGDATESWQATEGAEGAGDQDFAGDPDAWQVRNGSTSYSDDLPGLEQTLGQEITLREHLMQQLMVDIDDPVDRMIGLYLIDLLEPSGYLTANLSEAALQLGCSVDRIEATLMRLQRFDPAGIFARSLSECLAIQLAERDRLDPAMRCLLDHLPMLANREANALMRLCGVDAEDLAGMVAEIRALNPKPGLAFDGAVAQPIVPDIQLRGSAANGWTVELNSDTLPRVLVNTRYYAKVSRPSATRRKRIT
jgi:RNA polymerase sigma-54 factor